MTATAGSASATFNGTGVCNYTSKASGNWSAPSTWIGECVPTASDAVTIASGHTVTVNVNSAAASLTFAAASVNSNVNLAPGVTLTIGGSVVANTPAANQTTEALNVGSGTLTVAGNVTLNGLGGQKESDLTVSTGTINIAGDISFGGNPPTQVLTSTGAASINIGGNFNTGGSLNLNAATTLTFNGGGAQAIGTYNPSNAFPIVHVNKSAGAVTMQGNLTIAGSLTLQSGTFDTSTHALNLEGDLVDNTTFIGSITFNGTNAQTISGTAAERAAPASCAVIANASATP